MSWGVLRYCCSSHRSRLLLGREGPHSVPSIDRREPLWYFLGRLRVVRTGPLVLMLLGALAMEMEESSFVAAAVSIVCTSAAFSPFSPLVQFQLALRKFLAALRHTARGRVCASACNVRAFKFFHRLFKLSPSVEEQCRKVQRETLGHLIQPLLRRIQVGDGRTRGWARTHLLSGQTDVNHTRI